VDKYYVKYKSKSAFSNNLRKGNSKSKLNFNSKRWFAMVFLYRKFEKETRILEMTKREYQKVSDDYFLNNKSLQDEKMGLIITANFEKLSRYKEILGENLIPVRQIKELH
jgi:hypothetical protein